MQTLQSWLLSNQNHFVGLVKLGSDKRPVNYERKETHWLFQDKGVKRNARVKDCIKFYDESEQHNIGVLVSTKILIIDCDVKIGKSDGASRWKELSDIPFTMPSSNLGFHIWVKNPLSGGVNSNMKSATIAGQDDDVSIELFSGHSQLVKIARKDFDFSTLNLNDLPELPDGFLDGVGVRGEYGAGNVDAVKSLSMELPHVKPLANLFLIASGVTGLERYDNYYKFTVALHNLSYYQANARGNLELAQRIRDLWVFIAKDYDYFKPRDWQKMTYIGETGLALRYLTRGNKYSRGVKSDLGENRPKLLARWKQFKL